MPTDVIMPQMGESIFEGTITKWLKKPGDTIQRDEPLFEISTDKVDAEIPAPASGVLKEIKAAEGSTVQVNSVVAVIDEAGSAVTAAAPAAPAAPAPAPVEASAPAAAASAEDEEAEAESGERVHSSPLVRKLARQHNIDLHAVPGTGIGGRITKEDILAFIERHPAGAPVPAAAAPVAAAPAAVAAPVVAAAPAPPATGSVVVPGDLVPMSPMRKKIAERMVESRRTSAHVHTVFAVDMTRIVALRDRLKGDFERRTGVKMTVMPFFCRAAIHGIRKFPILNSSVEGDNIRYHRTVNLGIAVALDWGLIVPVIKDAEEKNFLGLQRGITDLADRARARKLVPDEVAGGTFTITNPGNYGQMFGLPIIVQPQVAILGVGNIRKQPVVVTDANGQDSIAIRSICHVALGYDHRVIDGAIADQFLREVALYLQNWNEDVG
jgi:2-oxoglutarate dehydrogenase E2 component (dihydrolipoamide succinyltransferase)